jgi:hypothetical protein
MVLLWCRFLHLKNYRFCNRQMSLPPRCCSQEKDSFVPSKAKKLTGVSVDENSEEDMEANLLFMFAVLHVTFSCCL